MKDVERALPSSICGPNRKCKNTDLGYNFRHLSPNLNCSV